MPREHTTQLLFAAEATPSRDVLDSVAGFLEGPACRVDTYAFNGAGRCPLACLSVAAGEIAGTHADAVREALDTQVGGQMRGDPMCRLETRRVGAPGMFTEA
jgi:hypothetical protein